jgi:TetR/AcrR family transcriptional regulator of autoinduction and epiphytic fitness
MGGTEVVDGRKARSERSRAAIVDAFLSLLPDSSRRPTVEEIASAAGVSERSVYRHFPDVDALVHAAMNRRIEVMAPLAVFDVDPEDALPVRIRQMSAQRARFYEVALPLRRYTDRSGDDMPALTELEELRRVFLRDQLDEAFAAELAALDDRERDVVREGLEVVASWATWQHLREEQELDVADARRVMECLARRLLARAPVA